MEGMYAEGSSALVFLLSGSFLLAVVRRRKACGLIDDAPGKSAERPLVTVVMNTSPIKSNPSTDLLARTAASFKHVPGLQDCPKLIICDGYRVLKKRKKYDITESEAAAYEEFKKSVRAFSHDPSSVFFGAIVLELEGRHGFGLALKEGMQLVKTEFMMVAQHDWAFSRKCLDLKAAVHTMQELPHVKYIGMLSSPTLQYPHKILCDYGIDLKPHILKPPSLGKSCYILHTEVGIL
jgi:hypothetical protein